MQLKSWRTWPHFSRLRFVEGHGVGGFEEFRAVRIEKVSREG